MGGCLSVHSRKQKGQVPSNHNAGGCIQKDGNEWAPKNGIGQFVQARRRSVVRTGQVNDDYTCKHDNQCNDEIWFDSELWLDSDSDDDYRSVYGDSLPAMSNQSSSEQSTPRPTFTSIKESMLELVPTVANPEQHTGSDRRRLGEFLHSISPPEGRLLSEQGSQHTTAHKSDKGGAQQESSSQMSCLPRLLIPSVSFNDKKVSVSPGVHKPRNSLLRLPFKRRSNDFLDGGDPITPKLYVERPLAGSQIPFSSLDKLTEGTWSVVGPSTFKLRGSSYLRDKIKVFAAEYSMYEPCGVDVFVSPKKISHIARHVELPACRKAGQFPSLLILNIQIPMYPAAIFLNETDGEGLSLVMYHKLSEKHSKVPSYFQEMFTKVLNDEVERVRGFAGEFSLPFRERLKILGRVVNPEELHLSVPERKVVYAYNEKPVLSRPQHSFYQGKDYFEVDLDMHRFSYLARKGVESFRERLRLCILDLGLTVQGNKPDELPEHVLCCVRINKIDFTTCKQLVVNDSTSHVNGEKYQERCRKEDEHHTEPV